MRRRLLWLYPEAWRERYGEECGALLEDLPSSLGTTLDLLRGAILAHLRPLIPSPPEARVRGAIINVLGCFIAFCAVGSGFAKTTENYGRLEHVDPLLGVSHRLIVLGAIAGTCALALAAAPLAVVSLEQAFRTRERTLVRLVIVPPAAILSVAGSVLPFALWLRAHPHHGGVLPWLLLAPCLLCVAGGAFACWAAPRAILARTDVPRRAYAVSMPAAGLVALCMLAVTASTGAFLAGIVIDAPGVGGSGNGPGQLIDVTTSIALQLAGLCAVSAAAALSAVRGARAVRAL